MFGDFTGNDCSLWWTLNLNKLSRLTHTIRTSTEPCVHWMGTETNFVYNLIMSLFVNNASLIFILLTMSGGRVTREFLTQTTFLE